MNLVCKLFGHTAMIQQRSTEHNIVWSYCHRCGKGYKDKEKE